MRIPTVETPAMPMNTNVRELYDGFWLQDTKVEPAMGQITHPDGRVVRLQRKPMDVLVYLSASAGFVATKEQLIGSVWKQGYGGDETLKRCVYNVRRALGDDGDEPRFIRTIFGRGYTCLVEPRLIATGEHPLVRLDETDQSSHTPAPSQRTAVPGFRGKAAIAVLPFRIFSQSTDLEYLSEALAEDIVGHLQRYRTFPVISHHSTLSYADGHKPLSHIAAELDAGYIVTGNLRPLGESVIIRVQLIETAHQTTLGSRTYQSGFDQLIRLQSDITQDIVGYIEPEIERTEREQPLPSDPTEIEAWHLVRRGTRHQYRLTRQDSAIAKDFFERAIAMDPACTDAHIQMAWWHFWTISAMRGAGDAWLPMERHINRAMGLDPQNPKVILLNGIADLMRGRPAEAEDAFRHAIRANPSFGWAHSHLGSALYLLGRPDEAIQSLRTSIRLSPFDLVTSTRTVIWQCATTCWKTGPAVWPRQTRRWSSGRDIGSPA